jgi:hypothetical protein
MANVDLVSQGVGKIGLLIQTRFHWICVVNWRRTEAMRPDLASLSTHAPQPSRSVQVYVGNNRVIRQEKIAPVL